MILFIKKSSFYSLRPFSMNTLFFYEYKEGIHCKKYVDYQTHKCYIQTAAQEEASYKSRIRMRNAVPGL